MVPTTARLLGKLFGPRHMSTLFRPMLPAHQIGGFFGAWLGGVALQYGGDCSWMGYAGMGLAVAAALVNLSIRKGRLPAGAPTVR